MNNNLTSSPISPTPVHARVGLMFALAVMVTVIDQLTKYLAQAHLTPGEYTPLLGDWFGLTLVYNPGAAFGMASGLTWILTLIALVVLFVLIRYARQITSVPWAITLGAFLGGNLGNLIDRLFREPGVGRGHVVDFLNYNGFFVGNIADIALVLGGIAFAVLIFFNVPMNDEEAQAQSESLEDETVTNEVAHIDSEDQATPDPAPVGEAEQDLDDNSR